MPVFSDAIAFASSSTSGDAPRLSTTSIASVVAPSSSTSARACSGSWALSAIFALKPPGMFSGNSCGVTSTAAAPARSSAAGTAGWIATPRANAVTTTSPVIPRCHRRSCFVFKVA
ncbi:MAG: hypothetical protein HYV60_04135 [Planctomycetia bacterium]|nr:hypothetical protein [Planctomycetia bacterium]